MSENGKWLSLSCYVSDKRLVFAHNCFRGRRQFLSALRLMDTGAYKRIYVVDYPRLPFGFTLGIVIPIWSLAVTSRRNFFSGRLPASLDFTENGSGHPHKPDDTSNYSIGDLAFAGVVREPQAKAPVDDAKGNQGAAKPEMRIGRSLASLMLLEEMVVDEARDWLEEEKGENDNADNWMVVCRTIAELLIVS